MKGYKYKVIYNEYTQRIYSPKYYEYENEYNEFVEKTYPEIYVCELENVNIIGTNSIVFDEYNCIYDMPFRDKENKFNLKYKNTLYSNKDKTEISYNGELVKYIEEGIMLLESASYNYYHFNVEILSKLCVIDEIEEYKNTPLIVDSRIIQIPQLKEELEILNKHNREIIYIEEGYLGKVKKLICLGDMSILPVNIVEGSQYKYNDCITSEIGINLLNKKLALKGEPTKKLFISRKNTQFKRIDNQEEVEETFVKFGYEIIYPEEMSFKEQLNIFSKANTIAGVSGSGLTNIIFSNENTKLICIYTKEIEISSYSNLAGILNRKCYYLDASKENNKNEGKYYYCKSNLIIDIDYLTRFLEKGDN